MHIWGTNLLTDQGTNFQSKLFKSITKFLKGKQIKTSPYHPQSNRVLERSHYSLGNYLRNYSDNYKSDWDSWIPFAMFFYNTIPHSITKIIHFELVIGHKTLIPHSFLKYPDPLYNYDDYSKELNHRMPISHKIPKENILKSKTISKEHYGKNINPQTKIVDELVLLKIENKTAI